MKNVIVFGFGELGKKLINNCLNYNAEITIKAIADNNAKESVYKNIPIVKPQQISEYAYDEIWISTVYFDEIISQLSNDYGIEKSRMRYADPVEPVLEYRLRQKYELQLNDPELVSEELEAVLAYIKNNPIHMYCYPFFDEYLNKKTELWFDDGIGMYYGIYEGKKMYLSKKLNTYQKARMYLNSVIMEQDSRCPHCYWNDKEMCRVSGVGIDVGAAEGIFALKIIDQIDHIYLIEADEDWAEALSYTFYSYKDKVSIVRKYASNEDRGDYAELDTVLSEIKVNFMKIDIEGMELDALMGAEETIRNNKMELAVCVYHHEDDNERIGKWLRERGYQTSNSPGLVVCQGDWELEADETDFRKALIFANNN